MKLDNFSFHIVYDARLKEKKALQQLFRSENTFKQDVDVWEDKPFIHQSIQVNKDHPSHNAVTYHLKEQNTILFIPTFYDNSKKIWIAVFQFYQDCSPYNQTSPEI